MGIIYGELLHALSTRDGQVFKKWIDMSEQGLL